MRRERSASCHPEGAEGDRRIWLRPEGLLAADDAQAMILRQERALQ
jgi:hypothetical protein